MFADYFYVYIYLQLLFLIQLYCSEIYSNNMKTDKRAKRLKCVLKRLLSYLLHKNDGSWSSSLQAEAWEIVFCEICPDQQDKPKDIITVVVRACILKDRALSAKSLVQDPHLSSGSFQIALSNHQGLTLK